MDNTVFYKGQISDLQIEVNGLKDSLQRQNIFNDLLIDERLINLQEIKRLNSIIEGQHQDIQRLQLEIQKMINDKVK